MNNIFEADSKPVSVFSDLRAGELFHFSGELFMRLFAPGKAVNLSTGVLTEWPMVSRVDRVAYEPLRWRLL